MFLILLCFALLGALAAPVAAAGRVREPEPVPEVRRPSLLREFHREHTEGTMVVLQRGRLNRLVVVGQRRSKERVLPSSTFKIPNALIVFDRGVASGPDEQFPGPHPNYLLDGKPLLPAECEGDLTFRIAFQMSCIPIFQEFARCIGRAVYKRELRDLGYGNGRSGVAPVDDFWLHGPFGISAREQVAFLERLRLGELPVRAQAMRDVRDMLVMERRDGVTVRGKTGFVFAQDGEPQQGWWVGWVTRRGQRSVFALQMDMERADLVPARMTIGRRILERLHAFAP